MNENEIHHRNSWDSAKALLREKFIVINTYLRKKKNLKYTALFYTSGNKKKDKTKPKINRREGDNKDQSRK